MVEGRSIVALRGGRGGEDSNIEEEEEEEEGVDSDDR